MSNAQKDYLKKWAIVLGVIFGIVLMITCIILGHPFDFIALGAIGCVCLVCIATVIVEIIGSMIWHWRLMGECKTKWEAEMLAYWWRFMNYHSGNWEELIPCMIEAETDEKLGTEREQQMELFERFKAVKAPRVLQW